MNLSNDAAFHRAREIQELATAGATNEPAARIAHLRLAVMHAAKAAKARLMEESRTIEQRYVVRDPSNIPKHMPVKLETATMRQP